MSKYNLITINNIELNSSSPSNYDFSSVRVEPLEINVPTFVIAQKIHNVIPLVGNAIVNQGLVDQAVKKVFN